MAHPALSINPFDILLRLGIDGKPIDRDFKLWLACFRDPPIRTTRALIDNCPRVDWLFWYLEQLVYYDHLNLQVLLFAGPAVREHLDRIANGRTYSVDRNERIMPHAEGLAVLRDQLARNLR